MKKRALFIYLATGLLAVLAVILGIIFIPKFFGDTTLNGQIILSTESYSVSDSTKLSLSNVSVSNSNFVLASGQTQGTIRGVLPIDSGELGGKWQFFKYRSLGNLSFRFGAADTPDAALSTALINSAGTSYERTVTLSSYGLVGRFLIFEISLNSGTTAPTLRDFIFEYTSAISCNSLDYLDNLAFFQDGRATLLGGSYPNGPINDILVDGSNVYVGGKFTQIGGVSASNIAKFDGQTWHALGGSGGGVNGEVRSIIKSIAISGFENEIVVGGEFNNIVGSGSSSGLAFYNAASDSWGAPVNSDYLKFIPGGSPQTGNGVFSMAVDQEYIYAGGMFGVGLELTRGSFAKYNRLLNQWVPLASGPGSYSNAYGTYYSLVRDMSVYNGNIYLAGKMYGPVPTASSTNIALRYDIALDRFEAMNDLNNKIYEGFSILGSSSGIYFSGEHDDGYPSSIFKWQNGWLVASDGDYYGYGGIFYNLEEIQGEIFATGYLASGSALTSFVKYVPSSTGLGTFENISKQTSDGGFAIAGYEGGYIVGGILQQIPVCLTVPSPGISGYLYQDQGNTINSDALPVSLYVDGVFAETVTSIDGYYSFNTKPNLGQRVIVVVNSGAYLGSTLAIADGNSISDLDLYNNTMILRDEAGSSINGSDIVAQKDIIASLNFIIDGSNNIIVNGDMLIWSGTNFSLETGALTAKSLYIKPAATFAMATLSELVLESQISEGYFSNEGSFSANYDSTITLTGSNKTNFIGDIKFGNLTSTVPGKKIVFEAGHDYQILGKLVLQGIEYLPIKIRSSADVSDEDTPSNLTDDQKIARQFSFGTFGYSTWSDQNDGSGDKTVSNLDVKDSSHYNIASPSDNLAIDPEGISTDLGNTQNWFTKVHAISGRLYLDKGQTPASDGHKVSLMVNGEKKESVTTTTGDFVFSVQAQVGEKVVIYVESSAATRVYASTFFIADGSIIDNLALYQNTVIVRQFGSFVLDQYNIVQPYLPVESLVSANSGDPLRLSAIPNTERQADFLLWAGTEFSQRSEFSAGGLYIEPNSVYNGTPENMTPIDGTSGYTIDSLIIFGDFVNDGTFNANLSHVKIWTSPYYERKTHLVNTNSQPFYKLELVNNFEAVPRDQSVFNISGLLKTESKLTVDDSIVRLVDDVELQGELYCETSDISSTGDVQTRFTGNSKINANGCDSSFSYFPQAKLDLGNLVVEGSLVLNDESNKTLRLTTSSVRISAGASLSLFSGHDTGLIVGGDWTNDGVFESGEDNKVTFDGTGVSSISGETSFNYFESNTPGKILAFEQGKTFTMNYLKLNGSADNPVKIRSLADVTDEPTPSTLSEAESQSRLFQINPLSFASPEGQKYISFVSVKDSENLNPEAINPENSVDLGNTINWFVQTRILRGTLWANINEVGGGYNSGAETYVKDQPISFLVNGKKAGSVTTGYGGFFEASIPCKTGDVVVAYIENGFFGYTANTIKIMKEADENIDLHYKKIFIQDGQEYSNSIFRRAVGSYQDSVNILFSVDNSNNLTLNALFFVGFGTTFEMDGDVTANTVWVKFLAAPSTKAKLSINSFKLNVTGNLLLDRGEVNATTGQLIVGNQFWVDGNSLVDLSTGEHYFGTLFVGNLYTNYYAGNSTIHITRSLHGSLTVNGEGFVAGNSTVILEGGDDAHISGGPTFWNLICEVPGKIIMFNNSPVTVLNQTTLKGSEDNRLNLIRIENGIDYQWGLDPGNYIDVNGNKTIAYVSVKDGFNMQDTVINPLSSEDLGNNVRWFGAASCNIDSDCSDGNICDEGACVPACSENNPCEDGEICLESSHCAPVCDIDTPCPEGLVCNNGVCLPPCSDANPCAKGETCVSGVCTDGSLKITGTLYNKYQETLEPVANAPVKIAINGVLQEKTVTTDASGNYSIDADYKENDRLLIVGGASNFANTFTISGAGDLTGMNLYQGGLYLRNEIGSEIYQSDIFGAKSNVGSNAIYSNIDGLTVDGSLIVATGEIFYQNTVATLNGLYVMTGADYKTGGFDLTVLGDFQAENFTHDNGTVYFGNNAQGTVSNKAAFYNTVFDGINSDSAWTLSGELIKIAKDLTLKQGNLIFDSKLIIDGNYLQEGGVAQGTDKDILVHGCFLVSGGKFKSTSSSLTIENNADIAATTFEHSNGTVIFETNVLGFEIRANNNTFNNLVFDKKEGKNGLIIVLRDSFAVANNLEVQNSFVGTGSNFYRVEGRNNPLVNIAGNLVFGENGGSGLAHYGNSWFPGRGVTTNLEGNLIFEKNTAATMLYSTLNLVNKDKATEIRNEFPETPIRFGGSVNILESGKKVGIQSGVTLEFTKNVKIAGSSEPVYVEGFGLTGQWNFRPGAGKMTLFNISLRDANNLGESVFVADSIDRGNNTNIDFGTHLTTETGQVVNVSIEKTKEVISELEEAAGIAPATTELGIVSNSGSNYLSKDDILNRYYTGSAPLTEVVNQQNPDQEVGTNEMAVSKEIADQISDNFTASISQIADSTVQSIVKVALGVGAGVSSIFDFLFKAIRLLIS